MADVETPSGFRIPVMATECIETVRAYYRTIDEKDYSQLEALLAPDFIQERPDQTLDGRELFIRFMQDERPMTDTTHAVDAIYQNEEEVAVRGRLLRDDDRLFGFVDVFSFADEKVTKLRTYTH